MPRVFIPPLLKPLCGDVDSIEIDARHVGDAIAILEEQFPGVRKRLCDADELKPGLTVAVDGNVSTLGLLHRLEANSELHFLPAIGGG